MLSSPPKLPTRRYASMELYMGGLLALLYVPLMWHWVDGWLNKSISIQHEYFSHGLLGIPFAIYLAWDARRRWQQLDDRLHPAGVAFLVLAILFYGSGTADLMNLSLPLMLIGLCWSLKGTAGLRLQAFPLMLIGLATPTQLPYLIEPYILPLQRFIAAIAGFILLQLGIDVEVNEIYLSVNQQLVEVAPHCAGLKMLFTSFYMGLILTYWAGLYVSKLRTGLFFIGIVFVSVTGNILRNTLLSFFHGHSMENAFHWLHESWGGDLYSAVMLGSLILLVRLIERFVPTHLNLQRVEPVAATTQPRTPYDF
ncbi:MAG: cyanoexosortase B [Cyanobacteria bacterium P01_D01_bin.44]